MTYTEYLKSKRTLLITWFIIHSFALFVNFFSIEGDISSESNRSNYKDYTTTNLFTTEHKINYSNKKPSSQFWPFVKFYDSDVSYNPYMNRKEDFSKFRGIFYQYDISEFIAYTALLFLILFFVWPNKKEESTT